MWLFFRPRYGIAYEEHVQLERTLFQRAANHHIAIDVSKMVFAEPTAQFGGYIVSSGGFKPNPDLIGAIREFPRPKNIKDIRAFHGLCQQVSNFLTKVAETTFTSSEERLDVGMDDNAWRHVPESQNFLIWNARSSLLRSESPDCTTCRRVTPLKQKEAEGKWRMVQAGSRYLSRAGSRYAMIEL